MKYKIDNPLDRAKSRMGEAEGAYGSMMQDIPANRDPGKSVSGAVMNAAGGAVLGNQVGTALGAAAAAETAAAGTAAAGTEAAATTALGLGPVGWAGAGIALALGSYFIS